MSDNVLLALREVSFAYGEGETAVSVLEGVNFSVEAGQRLALLGRSGSGKVPS
jgi:ABC-type transport system involved in cytochrome bd biosynthesis fused ATPase/permease subunit